MINKIKNLNTITAFSHTVICISLIINRMHDELSFFSLLLIGLLVVNSAVMTMCRFIITEKKIEFFRDVICDSLFLCLSAPAILLCVEPGSMNICCFFVVGLSLLPFLKTTKKILSKETATVDIVNKKSAVFMKVLIVLVSCYTIYGLIVEIIKDIIVKWML